MKPPAPDFEVAFGLKKGILLMAKFAIAIRTIAMLKLVITDSAIVPTAIRTHASNITNQMVLLLQSPQNRTGCLIFELDFFVIF